MAPVKKTMGTKSKNVNQSFNATEFLNRLSVLQKTSPSDNSRYFTGDDKKNLFLGVRMASIFTLAKEFVQMPLDEIEKLIASRYYEARMGAVSIMDFQARDKKTSNDQKKALYALYMNHHDRINNWDLVDRSAPYVVGGYLFDKSRKPLYQLARSSNVCERRTAIVSTYYFIRKDDLDDTFRIAAVLVNDKEDSIHKAVGSWIREAGKRDETKLIAFLDQYGSRMPRVMLRYAIEKLDKKKKEYYMNSTR